MSTPFQISLAPDQLWQAINPMTFNQRGAQFGFINIDLGDTAESDLERKLLDRVGSYGRQLGRIGDVLEVLVAKLPRETLSDDERAAVEDFSVQMREIKRIKDRRG